MGATTSGSFVSSAPSAPLTALDTKFGLPIKSWIILAISDSETNELLKPYKSIISLFIVGAILLNKKVEPASQAGSGSLKSNPDDFELDGWKSGLISLPADLPL